MKKLLILALAPCAALASAQTINLSSPSDWRFDYRGSYAFVPASASGSANVATLLGTSVGGVFAALQQGQVTTTNSAVTIAQSGATVTTSPLTFAASTPTFSPLPSLTYGLGDFVVNALALQNGTYSGTLNGTSLKLSRSSSLTANATLDLTATGFGIRSGSVYNLTASLLGSQLDGTVDGRSGNVGTHVTGTAGGSQAIGIFLSQDLYTFGVKTSIPSTQIGVLQTMPTGWSLSRSVANPVPEPGTVAALGLGALSLLRRRKRA